MRSSGELAQLLSAPDLLLADLLEIREELAHAYESSPSVGILRLRARVELQLRERSAVPPPLGVGWEILREAERLGDRSAWHSLLVAEMAFADGRFEEAADNARLALARGMRAQPQAGWLLFKAVRELGGDLEAVLAELGAGAAPEPYARLARLETARLAGDGAAIRRKLRAYFTALPRAHGVPSPSVERAAYLFETAHDRWIQLDWLDLQSFDDPQIDRLEDAIRSAVRERKPFALIRVGDGEAAFASGRRPSVGGATLNGAGEPLPERLSSTGELRRTEHRRLVGRFLGALARADFLGIPDIGMYARGVMWTVQPAIYDRLALSRRAGDTTHWAVHYRLEYDGVIDEAVRLAPAVAIVGPESPEAIGLPHPEDVTWYPVPGELLYHGQSDALRHYPERFEQLMATLEVPEPGTLFLVGAGILGKIYCGRIKELGGVALDVGGLMDVWAGNPTRAFAPQFLRRREGHDAPAVGS